MFAFNFAFVSLLCVAGIASAQWQPHVPKETRSLDQIYEAAQKEDGPLVVLGGGDAGDQWDAVIKPFKKRFPKIKLDLTVDLSKYHDSRVDRQWYEHNVTADIAALQTLHDFSRWKGQNRLLYYKPKVWDDLYTSERDADGAYLPVLVFGFGDIKYDKTKIDPADVPSNYGAFTDPKWRGKLVLTYPNDDDAVSYLFSKIVSTYGVGWLEALNANDVQWVRGSYTPAAHIAAAHKNSTNKRSITFTTGSTPESFFGSKHPMVPANQAMSWSQTAAIFASTKKPESSKLFLSWLVSDEFQQPQADAGAYVTRASIDKNKIFDQNYSDYTGFRNFMIQRDVVGWWNLQFETVLGTAQGPSPLVLYP